MPFEPLAGSIAPTATSAGLRESTTGFAELNGAECRPGSITPKKVATSTVSGADGE